MRCSARRILLLTLAATGCAPATPEPPTPFGDPAGVLEAVFEAARSGETDVLRGLCPADGSGDGDVRDICAMTPEDEGWDEFVEWFALGRVTAAPMIRGDHATVRFVFGPGGATPEEMRLIRVEGRWYLSSF